jgi:hypothetical protein
MRRILSILLKGPGLLLLAVIAVVVATPKSHGAAVSQTLHVRTTATPSAPVYPGEGGMVSGTATPRGVSASRTPTPRPPTVTPRPAPTRHAVPPRPKSTVRAAKPRPTPRPAKPRSTPRAAKPRATSQAAKVKPTPRSTPQPAKHSPPASHRAPPGKKGTRFALHIWKPGPGKQRASGTWAVVRAVRLGRRVSANRISLIFALAVHPGRTGAIPYTRQGFFLLTSSGRTYEPVRVLSGARWAQLRFVLPSAPVSVKLFWHNSIHLRIPAPFMHVAIRPIKGRS